MGFDSVLALPLALAALSAVPSPARAFAQDERAPDPGARLAPSLHLESLRVTIGVADGLATTELDQVFRNDGGRPHEGVYVWPLPEDAAVSGLELWIDGTPQKGEILDRDKARAIYEDIVRNRRDPALLEWMGRGCVRVSAFPIPPRGTSRVRLRFASALAPAAGALELLVPMRVASLAPRGDCRVVIEATVESSRALGAVAVPTHACDVRRDGDRRARLSFEGGRSALERDLQIVVQPLDRDLGALLLPYRAAGEDGFFLLHVTPRADASAERVLPKDVIFVVDTSGSMTGEKMRQAKRALSQCVGRLRPADRFALVRFSTEASSFREALEAPSPETLAAAQTWIDRLEAAGGTNLDDGLARGLAAARDEGRPTMVFLLTDGVPTLGVTDEAALRSRVRSRASLRVFTFGVGDDVNTKLLDGLVEETRGAREYVRPGEDVEVKVSALFDKVASPVVTDVSVTFAGADAYDVHPKRLPDLFRGSSLVIAGRYRGEGKRTLRVEGRVGSETRTWTYDVEWPRVAPKNDAVRPLWASRRVGYLLDEIRLRGSNAELVEEVRRIGREYGIVTPYTSYLVVEEARRLARARGIHDDRFRFADLDGDGRRDAPAGPAGAFEEAEAREKKDASASGDDFDRLDDQASGGDAVKASVATQRLLETAGGGGRRGEGNAFLRTVDGRVFHLVGSVWVDRAFVAGANVQRVSFLSDAYFELLRKSPDLARILSLGSRVLVEWQGVFYEVS